MPSFATTSGEPGKIQMVNSNETGGLIALCKEAFSE